MITTNLTKLLNPGSKSDRLHNEVSLYHSLQGKEIGSGSRNGELIEVASVAPKLRRAKAESQCKPWIRSVWNASCNSAKLGVNDSARTTLGLLTMYCRS